MSTTTDPTDPRLTHGVDDAPVDQAAAYLVMSEAERAKGFVRPVRRTYVHRFMLDGSPVPRVLLPEHRANLGGCGMATTMAQPIAETYAREPGFYGGTYCVGCRKHLVVGEFLWEDGSVVGS